MIRLSDVLRKTYVKYGIVYEIKKYSLKFDSEICMRFLDFDFQTYKSWRIWPSSPFRQVKKFYLL